MGRHPTDPTVIWKRGLMVGECLEYQGARTTHGYGAITIARRQWRVPRVAWTLLHGPIPIGMVVRHSCDNPPCFRPEHLLIGRQADNATDRKRRGRSARLAGEANGSAKLTLEQVQAIRAASESAPVMARIYGVTKSHITAIRRGERW